MRIDVPCRIPTYTPGRGAPVKDPCAPRLSSRHRPAAAVYALYSSLLRHCHVLRSCMHPTVSVITPINKQIALLPLYTR